MPGMPSDNVPCSTGKLGFTCDSMRCSLIDWRRAPVPPFPSHTFIVHLRTIEIWRLPDNMKNSPSQLDGAPPLGWMLLAASRQLTINNSINNINNTHLSLHRAIRQIRHCQDLCNSRWMQHSWELLIYIIGRTSLRHIRYVMNLAYRQQTTIFLPPTYIFFENYIW